MGDEQQNEEQGKPLKKQHGLKGRKRPKEVRDKISKALKGKPKTYPSHLEGLTGENHPAYKHGQGATRKYEYKKQSAWIQGVKRALNFRCFITGRSTALHCHHLIAWAYEPTRYSIENGVAIAREIHQLFHNKYGRGHTTPKQFEEFCEKHYNITSFPWRQGNHKPSFSLNEEQAKIDGFMEFKAKQFSELVESRGHKIIDGFYSNNSSKLTIRCLHHDAEFNEVVARLYKKAAYGLQCCALAKQSAAVSAANRKRAK